MHFTVTVPPAIKELGAELREILAKSINVSKVIEVWIRYNDGVREKLMPGRVAVTAIKNLAPGDLVQVLVSTVAVISPRVLNETSTTPVPEGEQNYKRLGDLLMTELPPLFQKVCRSVCLNNSRSGCVHVYLLIFCRYSLICGITSIRNRPGARSRSGIVFAMPTVVRSIRRKYLRVGCTFYSGLGGNWKD